jgi:putative membrane protein
VASRFEAGMAPRLFAASMDIFEPANDQAREANRRLLAQHEDAERILLSTMQTSLSLIGFGFTINQIFSDVAVKAGVAQSSPLGARVGLSLLVLGLLLLAGGLWSYLRTNRFLTLYGMAVGAREGFQPLPLRLSPIFVVACLLMIVAFLTLLAILVRVLA